MVIDGNRMLGGADWDAKLFELINSKFIAQAGLADDPTADEDFAQKLMTGVEETKKTLSRKDRASVTLSYRDALEKVEVTRAEFEEATRTLVDQTLEIVGSASRLCAGKEPGLVLDEVLLVGGSSRMPMIEASLENEMGWKLHKTELDLAVAKGAAVYGQGTVQPDPWSQRTDGVSTYDVDQATLVADGDKRLIIGGATVEVRNVLSRSLGVQFARQNVSFPDGWEPYIGFIARANDSLPNDWTIQGETASDGATELPIHIFEQASEVENESPASNREVTPQDGAVLRNLPSLPAGSPVHFDLHIDAEGKATLSAFEPASNQRIRMGVSLSVMQKEEVEAARGHVSGMVRRD